MWVFLGGLTITLSQTVGSGCGKQRKISSNSECGTTVWMVLLVVTPPGTCIPISQVGALRPPV